jgi:hypothetical protein
MDFDTHQPRSRPRPLVEHTNAADVRRWRRNGEIADGQFSARVGGVTIRLSWLECHFGSARPLWLCPKCGRPAYILYHRAEIACRRCLALSYVSQRCQPDTRLLNRAMGIRWRLGQREGGTIAPFPLRPKARHWRTFFRDRRKGQVIEQRMWRLVACKYGIA